MIVGIDPGFDGGIAALHESADIGVSVAMPIITGPPRRYDYHAIKVHLLTATTVVVEEPPKAIRIAGQMNSVATIGLWQLFSWVEGFCAAKNVRCLPVRPGVWRKSLLEGMPRKTTEERKGSSISLCQRLWPALDLRASTRCRKPHDGIAEALLLAEYGRRLYAATKGEQRNAAC